MCASTFCTQTSLYWINMSKSLQLRMSQKTFQQISMIFVIVHLNSSKLNYIGFCYLAGPPYKPHCNTFLRLSPSLFSTLYKYANNSFSFSLTADSESTAEPGAIQDILTCGSCQKTFALGDIVKFIQHKVLQCNKENYGQCFTQGEIYKFF